MSLESQILCMRRDEKLIRRLHSFFGLCLPGRLSAKTRYTVACQVLEKKPVANDSDRALMKIVRAPHWIILGYWTSMPVLSRSMAVHLTGTGALSWDTPFVHTDK